MAKPTKISLFKDVGPRAETLMDKISRAAKEIVDDENEQRELKTARLRKARLEREGDKLADLPAARTEKSRKAP
jgi:hypothetical protein